MLCTLELNAAKEKLEIVSGAAPPPFRIFAGGLPHRRMRRNAFGLIQECYTTENEAPSLWAVIYFAVKRSYDKSKLGTAKPVKE